MKQGLTTQCAETLLSDVVKHTENVSYDVRLALHFIQEQVKEKIPVLSISF